MLVLFRGRVNNGSTRTAPPEGLSRLQTRSKAYLYITVSSWYLSLKRSGHVGVGSRLSTMSNILRESHGGRLQRRFPILQNVRYQCINGSRILAAGIGKTLEISSRDVRFTTQQPLARGQRIKLSMDWPATLDDNCRMKLEIFGWILRSDRGEASARIERYEFRTRGTQLAVMPA
jgi:hypothetical protein